MAKLPGRKILWNGRTIAIISAAVIIVTAALVFLTNKRSIYDELEITVAIIAFALFIFLTYGLYNGATIVGKPIFPKLKQIDTSGMDFTGDLTGIELGEGIFGIIGTILLWIVLAIVIVLLLSFILTVLWSAILIFAFVLYFLFFRALRIVFLKSKICKGDLGMSLKYSFLYSILYTGWIFGITMLTKYFSTKG